MKTLPPLILIWLGCTFAWVVLGTSLVARTGGTDAEVRRDVHRLWGPPMRQQRPTASIARPTVVEADEQRADGRGGTTTVRVRREGRDSVPVPIAASRLAVRLDLEHRRKGLLWFPTYAVGFQGRYTFENPDDVPRALDACFPLDGDHAVYDGFAVEDEAGARLTAVVRDGRAMWTADLGPHERRTFRVRYRSRGTSSWSYAPASGTGEVRDFALEAACNARRIDFAPGSVAPTRHAATADGWAGAWTFESLVASAPIGIVLPERLNPGPLASRITFFAPVGLLFFLFVAGIAAAVERRTLHAMHWFLIGCAFFAFHLLFAYLVDHVAVLPSFLISAAVSILLVATYARLFTGWRFALRRLGAAQLVYLVLFSASFFWEGFTGLAITIGAIVTLFVVMQATGRVDWARLDTREGSVPARA